MEWAAIIRDVVVGLLIAGCVGAWVPNSFWHGFFLSGHPLAAKLWGPVIGPVVAILTFVCSIGNVPLAAVLWQAGISFGGVTAFIFADLLILPILNIYRKYYGIRMTLVILGTFYAAMVVAGYVVELVFGGLGLIPSGHVAKVGVTGVSLNYTTWLNIVFLVLAAVLLVRFVRTGGMSMLRMMGGPADSPHGEHCAAGHDDAGRDETGHNGIDHAGASHAGASHDGADLEGADQDGAGHDEADQDRADRDKADGTVVPRLDTSRNR
jgi:hypothetical protein